ncbi:hypothetical protein GGR58DRAFT_451584 [Xylaria digitata]|nr:hypothetical protein GGR58DRAFT_451584 [Xylaria digitata]
MSSMSRNNSVNSLMGFSVHQPAIGSPLQFFPAMGSQQLDDMIDAYVPGDASILDKRAAVSMEFFEHSVATGELFKFFMVYPTLGSTNTSPTLDSGYQSGFTTSPVMSESQWNTYSSQITSLSSSKKASSANDFSNLPGMKIMTKDGRDVTNSASRGCKTKEQRDHAHLMRIIKACDSCRRKKTKCDPSHKRSAASTSSGKVTKKTSRTPRPAAAPPQTAANQASTTTEFDQILSGSSSSLDSFFAESLNVPTDSFSTEWDQFIQYDEEPTESIPYDYDFFLDPAGFFSPSTTASFSSSSTSPSQLSITPIDRDVNITDDTTHGHDHRPILPYLNPGGVEAGSDYVDFNLYSPQSSFLDDDLGLVKEVAASPVQSQRRDLSRHRRTGTHQEAANNAAVFRFSNCAVDDNARCSDQQNVISDAVGDGLFHDTSNYMHQWSEGMVMANASDQSSVLDSRRANIVSDRQAGSSHAVANTVPTVLPMGDNILEGATSQGLYGRERIHGRRPSRSLSDRGSLQPQAALSAAGYDTERLRDQYAIPQGTVVSRPGSAGVVRVAFTDSPSSEPHILRLCSHDGLSCTKASVTSSATKSRLPTQSAKATHGQVRSGLPGMLGLELNVLQHELHNVPHATATHTPMLRAPSRSENPTPYLSSLPSPSPEVTTHSRNARLVAASVGALSLALSLSSLRTSIVKCICLIKEPSFQSSYHLRYNLRYIAAMLIMSLALFALPPLVSFLSMSALPIVAGYIRVEKLASSPGANTQPSNPSPSHTLPHAILPRIDLVDNFKVTCANIIHVVRCDITRKLKSLEGHPRSRRPSGRQDQPKTSQGGLEHPSYKERQRRRLV